MSSRPAPTSANDAPAPGARELAQLLVPTVHLVPGRGLSEQRTLLDDALKFGVGGFHLIGGEQDAVRALAKDLQLKSRHPLLIAADLERGAGQQFAGATGLPPVAAITAAGDIESLRRAARLTAREARTMGVNWNLGPVCDLELNGSNPVIGTRALGTDPRKVGALATTWIEACQAEGVLACAKHFPGLGRTTIDSHLEMPVIDATAETLKDQDIAPFRAAIAAGVASIMTAHAAYPALDPSRMPATLSRELLQWLLRQQLKYDNLIVADSLTMQGVLHNRTTSEAAVLALRAGCDLVLGPGNLSETLDALEAALAKGELDPDKIKQSMRRRLKWAQWASPPNDWRRPSGADLAWGGLLADRVIKIQHGPLPPIAGVSEVVLIDDDADVKHESARVDRSAILEALRVGGTDARETQVPTTASGGPLIIALFSDYLPHKSRVTLLDTTIERIYDLIEQAHAMQRGVILVGLGDPRFVEQLKLDAPTVIAWSGDRVMQQSAARTMQKTKK